MTKYLSDTELSDLCEHFFAALADQTENRIGLLYEIPEVKQEETAEEITIETTFVASSFHIHKKKEKTKTIKTLIIPDAHVKPDDCFDRFVALDNYIMEQKPDYIVQLGDFINFSSLSNWDKNNKLKMEGIRYKEDIVAGNKAIDLMFKSSSKSRSYNPHIVWCFGNHDQSWPERYLEQNPMLAGHICPIEDLKLAERGITTIVPYKKYYTIMGTMFTHAPINAATQPVSGKFAAQKASELVSKSLVFGHSHSTAEFSCQRHGDDKVVQIYIAGCFFENVDSFAEDSTMTNTRCISTLTHWDEGRFDINQIGLDRLKASYL